MLPCHRLPGPHLPSRDDAPVVPAHSAMRPCGGAFPLPEQQSLQLAAQFDKLPRAVSLNHVECDTVCYRSAAGSGDLPDSFYEFTADDYARVARGWGANAAGARRPQISALSAQRATVVVGSAFGLRLSACRVWQNLHVSCCCTQLLHCARTSGAGTRVLSLCFSMSFSAVSRSKYVKTFEGSQAPVYMAAKTAKIRAAAAA